MLRSSTTNMRKEACWAVSNIAAGNVYQIQTLISAGLIPHVIKLLSDDSSETRKEAAYAMSNLSSCGTDQHVKHLVDNGCIAALSSVLRSKTGPIVSIVLEILENILKVGRRINEDVDAYGKLLEEAGAWSIVRRLQNERAHRLLEVHFPQKLLPLKSIEPATRSRSIKCEDVERDGCSEENLDTSKDVEGEKCSQEDLDTSSQTVLIDDDFQMHGRSPQQAPGPSIVKKCRQRDALKKTSIPPVRLC
jgi:hypothetical protein